MRSMKSGTLRGVDTDRASRPTCEPCDKMARFFSSHTGVMSTTNVGSRVIREMKW